MNSRRSKVCLRVRTVTRIVLSACCLNLVAIVAHPSLCLAQAGSHRPPGFLDKVISEGQKRVVKVYGAETGRIDGYATGIIVSNDGKILTIQGVFLDGPQVRVVLPNGESYQATISRRDRETQLALLTIPTETPDHFELSKEPVGQKGDWTVTLSNAFKVAEKTEPLSVMIGIISLRTSIEARLNRRDVAYRGELVLIDSISSNPGAGGGAVLTADGRLVGMIGKIINSSETNTRLNYAVPSSVLLEFVEGKPDSETVAVQPKQKSDLGIRLFRHGGRGAPAYIDRIVRGGPASEADLRPDDLIVTMNGEKIGSVRQYEEFVETLVPDQEVLIVVKRGVELLRVPVVAGAAKE
jgi:serine protease Do